MNEKSPYLWDRYDQAAFDWIKRTTFTYCLDVTLKKTIDQNIWMDRYLAESTAFLLRERLQKKFYGKTNSYIWFVAQYETGLQNGQPHLHIRFNDRRNLLLADVRCRVTDVIRRLDWTRREFHLERIYNSEGAVAYGMKRGIDDILWRSVVLDPAAEVDYSVINGSSYQPRILL